MAAAQLCLCGCKSKGGASTAVMQGLTPVSWEAAALPLLEQQRGRCPGAVLLADVLAHFIIGQLNTATTAASYYLRTENVRKLKLFWIAQTASQAQAACARQAAELCPPEAAMGHWPPTWTLTDHALVSVTFAFV